MGTPELQASVRLFDRFLVSARKALGPDVDMMNLRQKSIHLTPLGREIIRTLLEQTQELE
jgi:hypothetical protein